MMNVLPVPTDPLVKNFRKAAGLSRVYRCGSTDVLGQVTSTTRTIPSSWLFEDENSAEHVILVRAGLILDLRSPAERNESLAQSWMVEAPGGGFDMEYFAKDSHQENRNNLRHDDEKENNFDHLGGKDQAPRRFVYRIDILSPKRLFDYMSKYWISSPWHKLQYSVNSLLSSERLHEMRMDILNERGIQGIYEAMLETSGDEFCAALMAMTTYLESDIGQRVVVVHCVQGKDRTGLVIMLCQSILGIDDHDIIEDYHKSEHLLNCNKTSTEYLDTHTTEETKIKGKLNKSFFAGSPKAAMISTLTFIRSKYGSIDSYLDFIGFNLSWRRRFREAMQKENNSRDDFITKKPSPQMQSKL